MLSLAELAYLIAALCFILALRGLSHPESSRRGNQLGMLGMAIAIVTTLLLNPSLWLFPILLAVGLGGSVGAFIALRIKMTALPQLVAAFHSLVGLAAVLVALAAFYNPLAFDIATIKEGQTLVKWSSLIEMSLGAAIGAITFSGSVVAFAKLQGLVSGAPLVFPHQHKLNAALTVILVILMLALLFAQSPVMFYALIALALLLGFLVVLPIGGADMPVVVSMLNSYSGWAAAGIGFTLHNNLLIVTGALVGASGAILSYIMSKGMNRSIINVILGGFGGDSGEVAASTAADRGVKAGSAEDAAFLLKNAASVIIVPGYGMAVAQAQHALREMADLLKAEGVSVRYAIHPVAGRMPGHMNVLLAEANVPYDEVFEMEEINRDFAQTDAVFVIGANDITNPAAKTDPTSPIYGMPILDVDKAQTVLFVKRGMSAGYAGVENELFFRDNTMMLFSDAKAMCEAIFKSLKE